MYTDADLMLANAKRQRGLIFAGAFLGLSLCALIVGSIIRIEYLATFGTALFACAFYAVLELFAMPHVRYARFLNDVHAGISRETKVNFVRISDEPRMIDGVMCYDFETCEGNADNSERLFYFDADKQPPALEPGCPLLITSFGNYITQIEQ